MNTKLRKENIMQTHLRRPKDNVGESCNTPHRTQMCTGRGGYQIPFRKAPGQDLHLLPGDYFNSKKKK